MIVRPDSSTPAGVSPDEADDYARWFRCLADGTRILVLHVVAAAGEPLTVGQLVERVGKGQSTVSHHLRVLAAEEFVHLRVEGTRTFVTINPECLQALPDAAGRIMAQGQT